MDNKEGIKKQIDSWSKLPQQLLDLKVTEVERKRLYEDLESLQKRIESVLGVAKIGIDIIDAEFNIRYIDSEWKKVYGDSNGKKCYEYFMDRKEVCPGCGIVKALQTKSIYITEETLSKEGGRPIEVTTIPFQNEKGEWLVIETNVDISARKQVEKSLQQTEAQYRTTFDLIGEPMHVVGCDLRFVLINEAFKQWGKELGLETNVIGKTIFEVYPFLSKDKVDNEYRTVIDTGKVLITQETNLVGNREIITETRKIPIVEGKEVTRIATVVKDITVRKHLEDTLRESEERYKRMVEAVNSYVFTVYLKEDKPARTVYGPTCISVTGYSNEEFTLDPFLWIKIVPEEDKPFVQGYASQVLSGGKSDPIEHRIIRKDGAIRWVRNTSVPHVDSQGRLLYYDGLIQDITERKLIDRKLTKMNECFSNLVVNPLENINRLTSLCGQLLEADCAIYNSSDGELLCSIGLWNTPPDYKTTDKAEGHICHDVIKNNNVDVFILHDLQQTAYAKSDPNVARYNLQTYIGCPVKIDGESVGALCAVYKRAFSPSAEDKKIIGIIASALAVEEERRKTQKILEQRIKFEGLVSNISTNFIKVAQDGLDNEINRALKMIGECLEADRSYIFLVYANESKADNIYEWCAEGISPQIQELKGLSAEALPWFGEKIRKLEAINILSMNDFPPEAVAEKEFIQKSQVKSLLIVPMVYGKSIMGLIGLDSVRQEKKWQPECITLLKTAGEIFTNALERKKTNEALRGGERFLASIFGSIQDGICILDKELNIISVNPIMERWYAHAMPLVGKKCYEAKHGRTQPCRICPTQRTLQNGEPAYEVIPKVAAGGEIVGWLEVYSFPHFDLPTGQLIGAIEYIRDISERKRAEKKLEILNKELRKSNNRLKQLVLRDSQTGLFNHRYLEEVIEAEFYRARRYAHPLSVLMLDIDYFKSINDVYGHQFGDLALKQLARHLKRMVRRYDIIIRFGGEEFIIIFPGTDRATAMVLAQRLLETINSYSFGNRDHQVKLKVSMAVAAYPEDRIAKGMDLIEVADQILNKAKEFGGNRVYSSMDIKREKSSTQKKPANTNAKSLKEKLEKLNKQANQNLIEAVFAFAKTIEVKDHYTGEHVEKTVHYATEIANALALTRYEIELIKQAAMLHDLGKVGISEKILLKVSKLEKKEFEEIKKHPQIGADIIRPIQLFHNIIPLILYHHERWDGKGYPRGLKGEEIPVGARIIAISDVYQALISNRPYRKKAYSIDEAIKIIKDGSGSQFDPKIVNAFSTVLEQETKHRPTH